MARYKMRAESNVSEGGWDDSRLLSSADQRCRAFGENHDNKLRAAADRQKWSKRGCKIVQETTLSALVPHSGHPSACPKEGIFVSLDWVFETMNFEIGSASLRFFAAVESILLQGKTAKDLDNYF